VRWRSSLSSRVFSMAMTAWLAYVQAPLNVAARGVLSFAAPIVTLRVLGGLHERDATRYGNHIGGIAAR
jgi:hypothetical protein